MAACQLAQAGKSLQDLLWIVSLNVATEECWKNCKVHIQRDQTIHLLRHFSPWPHHHLLLATVAHMSKRHLSTPSFSIQIQQQYINSNQIKTMMRYYKRKNRGKMWNVRGKITRKNPPKWETASLLPLSWIRLHFKSQLLLWHQPSSPLASSSSYSFWRLE